MEKSQKYKKIRSRLEFGSVLIGIMINGVISDRLGIYGKEIFSLDTALSMAIFIAIVLVLRNISVKIADKWYKKIDK